ncbi:hypothetical protein BO86DRAFT_319165, partial [Aspergillus japonicus CBS 114.51]
AHTTTGCGKQGFPSAQPYLSHTPGANPFCCMFSFWFQRGLFLALLVNFCRLMAKDMGPESLLKPPIWAYLRYLTPPLPQGTTRHP